MAAEVCRLLEADVPSTSVSTPRSTTHEDTLFAHWNPIIERAASRTACGLGGSQSDADDLAQEARIRVFLTLRRRPELPSCYLYKIIRNCMRSGFRRQTGAFGFQSPLIVPIEEDIVDAHAFLNDDVFARLRVNAWVATLPYRLKVIYELIYEQFHTQREAAAILKISQPRVAQLHGELLEEGRRELTDLAT